jgi:FkbM family methyltransferase
MRLNHVVSVANAENLSVWIEASRKILKYIDSDRYSIVVPDSEVDLFVGITPVEFKVIPESVVVGDIASELRKRLVKTDSARFGWYLQQFIKLKYLLEYTEGERLLVWDADTVPLQTLQFFNETGQPSRFSSSEYHIPYFTNIYEVLGLDRLVGFSWIAQCFPITRTELESFKNFVEQKHAGDWLLSIISKIDFSLMSGFSEYETLGTFLSSVRESQNTQTGPWLRNGWSLVSSRNLKRAIRVARKRGFLYAAFERYDKNQNYSTSKTKLWSSIITWAFEVFQHLKNWLLAKPKPNLQNQVTLTELLKLVFSSNRYLHVVKIGANDGVQSDPLRSFLEDPGDYTAHLIEPLNYYADKLKHLYSKRSDIRISQVAAGPDHGTLVLHQIDPAIASELNGDGPLNDWAFGQGSSKRELVVWHIHQNSWRGHTYRANIPRFIKSIYASEVSVVPTRELINSRPEDTLLVVDFQGMELDVLVGLDDSKLPRYVIIEQDTGDFSASEWLFEHGYSLVFDGDNRFFQLPQIPSR